MLVVYVPLIPGTSAYSTALRLALSALTGCLRNQTAPGTRLYRGPPSSAVVVVSTRVYRFLPTKAGRGGKRYPDAQGRAPGIPKPGTQRQEDARETGHTKVEGNSLNS